MPRWMWWAPLGLFLVGCALVGLRYGFIAARITETDVISHYAQRYIQEHGGRATLQDCVALPDEGRVWIVVRCTPKGSDKVYRYDVNRTGGMEPTAVPLGPNT